MASRRLTTVLMRSRRTVIETNTSTAEEYCIGVYFKVTIFNNESFVTRVVFSTLSAELGKASEASRPMYVIRRVLKKQRLVLLMRVNRHVSATVGHLVWVKCMWKATAGACRQIGRLTKGTTTPRQHRHDTHAFFLLSSTVYRCPR